MCVYVCVVHVQAMKLKKLYIFCVCMYVMCVCFHVCEVCVYVMEFLYIYHVCVYMMCVCIPMYLMYVCRLWNGHRRTEESTHRSFSNSEI